MIRTLINVTSAELVKLRGLPVIVATVFGTVGVAVALAAAVTANPTPTTNATQVVAQIVPFLQVGFILIGVLTVASEYGDHQIRTTLTASPHRSLLVAAKILAYLATATITSVAAIGTGYATAVMVLNTHDITPASGVNGWPLVGAAGYLVLIGLFAVTWATVLRSLIIPLVFMLGLVLIVSPLLSGHTEHARWLPDQAGSLLYLPGADTVLTSATGLLVMLAWITTQLVVAVVMFRARDA